MLRETFKERIKNEDKFFELFENEIVINNIQFQKQMSKILLVVYAVVLLSAKLIIKTFRIHPLYYGLLVMLLIFFIISQALDPQKIHYKKHRKISICLYFLLYLNLVIIDVIPYKEDIAGLFPIFLIMFALIYIDKLKVYIITEFILSAIFIILNVLWKEPAYFSKDFFAILVALFVSMSCATIISNLRIKEALNRYIQESLSKTAAEAEAKAIAANGAKSQFLSQMSHEIRTPINAILGMNELIIREYADENLLKYAHNIRSAGNTLLSLVNDILDFSKIEAGKMELYCVEYDLASLISELVSMVDDRAKKKGLSLKVTVNEEMPHLLYGDNVRLKQIILNILTNAVKYTEHGSIHMSFDYTTSAHLDINGSIGLIVSVSDTGIGIREEDMERLFSPFERIEETRNRNVEGSGLGMSIVQKLLALMDSELHVRSEYGKGSTFSFTVRQETRSWDAIGDFNAAYNELVESETSYTQLFTAPDAKILIVDDTEMNIVVARNLIKDTKVNVFSASSGKEALEITKKEEFDLILIDHKMPEMDGMEMLWRLRSDEENPNHEKPCIALTANVFSGARETYKNSGFVDYLSKPIIGDSLEKMLATYLPEDKVLYTKEKKNTKHIPNKVVKYEDKVKEVTRMNDHIGDIREDYSDDEELYETIGMLMKRADITR
ncbi:ATP-binding protein [Butyrivibrio sp. NC2002]|uniref:ATP-binding protein n=1 Tax=Butyrivibrio sp. NC2002 TaxID=1410610 RepID=UPI00068C6837|nr:ATP-binding protein [Butyrivibrio sp. NC2002]